MKAAIALALLLATTARADVWKHAIDAGRGNAASEDDYELQMHNGDEAVLIANARGISRTQMIRQIDQAIRSYRNAAQTQPDRAEPYFRLGTVLQGFFYECKDPTGLTAERPTCNPPDPQRWREAVEAWDAFEARAPLDPRLNDVLFSRAIMRTKLSATGKTAKQDLEGAARDYQALLDRADGLARKSGFSPEQIRGNLAETYMMLGNLELAIDTYMIALREGADPSTAYGLAVALDRDEESEKALSVIVQQGVEAAENFNQKFQIGAVFYVPRGEEFYYFALINEAFDNVTGALMYWRQYIKSGAHPEYQGRAKAHIDALLAKQRKPTVRPRDPDDPFEHAP